jgi:hypothetical protein
MTMASELLATGAEREVKQLDEKLFFETYTPAATAEPTKKPAVEPKSKRR